MRVSVIIPAFNCALLAAEAVRSVLAQTRPAAEIIVINDGSTDDIAAHLAPFTSSITLISQANAGVAEARNRGLREATGEVIAFLDADDVWHPRKLELQLPLLDVNAVLGLLATGCYDWPGPVPTLPDPLPSLIAVPLDKLVIRNAFVTSTVIVRASVARAAGEFDRRLHGPEDYDYWLRIAQRSECSILPVPLSGYRSMPGSLSQNAVRMEDGMRLILKKLEAAKAFDPKLFLDLRALGYFHYSCGFMHHRAGHRSRAMGHLLRSLLKYPLPYDCDEVRYRLGRLRLLLSTVFGKR